MNKEYAKYLLNKTREDYNRIAEEFSRTRKFVWEELKYLSKFVNDGDKVLDIGCGNGRLIEIFKDFKIDYVGIDNSEKLIELAKEHQSFDWLGVEPFHFAPGQCFDKLKSAEFLVADALDLPFEDTSFDKAFSIAVLHHIPSVELRLKFLSEAKRVLKPGGLLILTVWGLWWRPVVWWNVIRFLFLKIFRKTKLDFKDIFVPWQKTLGRYIHCFTKSELKQLVEKAGFKVIEVGTLPKKESKNYNIYLVAEKG